jgi:1-acyl-sn-glycerol-3-phosphate acyltransferase
MESPTHASRPEAAPRDLLRPLRYLVRGPLLLLHLLLGLPLTLLLINPLTRRLRLASGERVDHRVIRLWQGMLMRIFGFRLRRFGTPLPGAALYVANHVSWIDIVLLHSQRAVGFVAKAEISRWPLVGWLASRGGTIYHHRGDNNSLHGVMHQMVARLAAGDAVGVFPEGRTTDGAAIGVFHARIFQPAVLAGVPVQPVALRYGAGGAAQTAVAFAPGERFLPNFLRLLGDPPRIAEVHFLAPVAAGADEGRRRLAEACRAQILAAMAS